MESSTKVRLVLFHTHSLLTSRDRMLLCSSPRHLPPPRDLRAPHPPNAARVVARVLPGGGAPKPSQTETSPRATQTSVRTTGVSCTDRGFRRDGRGLGHVTRRSAGEQAVEDEQDGSGSGGGEQEEAEGRRGVAEKDEEGKDCIMMYASCFLFVLSSVPSPPLLPVFGNDRWRAKAVHPFSMYNGYPCLAKGTIRGGARQFHPRIQKTSAYHQMEYMHAATAPTPTTD